MMNRDKEPVLSAFTSFRRNLLALTRRFLPDEDDAEDTLQEAFCRLWQHRADIGSDDEARAWAVTTVRNLCVDACRRSKPDVAYEFDDERDAPKTEGVDEELERHERFVQVERIIHERLTPMQREVLCRKEYNGQSVEEIAGAMHLQPAAVRMHLSRARKEIRECYKRWNHE